MNTVIAAQHVSKRYGHSTALDHVSFAVQANTISGLLGRNGAGKTTLMQILTGQGFATSGRVEVFGVEPEENAAVLTDVCFIKESMRYPDGFAVAHALRAGSLVFPRWDAAFAQSLVDDFNLPRKPRVKRLSRGMLSALGVIIGLASRAPLTLFDEPYLGLDAVARHMFYDRLLYDYAEHPRTVLLSTHLIDEVGDLIEHVLLLDKGRLVLDEAAETLRGQAFTELFSFAVGLNVTRRTFFAATALVVLVQSIEFGLLLYLLSILEQATHGWGIQLSFFDIGPLIDGYSPLSIVVYTVPLVLMSVIGLLMGMITKRWGANGIFTLAAASIVVFGGLAIVLTVTHAWSGIGSWLVDQSLFALVAGWTVVAVVALAADTYVMLRRAVP